jgi:hypothetical protein
MNVLRNLGLIHGHGMAERNEIPVTFLSVKLLSRPSCRFANHVLILPIRL